MNERGEARLREVTACETDADESPEGWQGRAIRKFILARIQRLPWLWGTLLMGAILSGSFFVLRHWDDAREWVSRALEVRYYYADGTVREDESGSYVVLRTGNDKLPAQMRHALAEQAMAMTRHYGIPLKTEGRAIGILYRMTRRHPQGHAVLVDDGSDVGYGRLLFRFSAPGEPTYGIYNYQGLGVGNKRVLSANEYDFYIHAARLIGEYERLRYLEPHVK